MIPVYVKSLRDASWTRTTVLLVVVLGGAVAGLVGGFTAFLVSALSSSSLRGEWLLQYLPGVVAFFLFAGVVGALAGGVVGLAGALSQLVVGVSLRRSARHTRVAVAAICGGVSAAAVMWLIAPAFSSVDRIVLASIAGVVAGVGIAFAELKAAAEGDPTSTI